MRSLGYLTALAVLVGTPLFAQEQRQSPAKPGDFKPFSELVAGAVEYNGLFDLYEKPDHLYLAITRDQLNHDFLLAFEIARGIGAGGVFGGTMLNIFEGKVIAFERRGNTVYLVQRPHRFPADPATPAGHAVELTFGSSVLETAKIESVREDSAVVIDVLGWMLSDLSGVSNRIERAVSDTPGKPGRATFDKSRSHLESVRAFPENVNVRAKLTFKPGESVSLPSVPDSRYVPVSIHYTFAQLPTTPMTPRLADERVGFFMTVHKDFTNDEKTFFKRYVNRWRLECRETAPADGLCEPKKPIVLYIDRNVPLAYRQAMKDGVEAFNAAFEAAGFRNAIRAEPLPDDADPEDIRYATLRWNVSSDPGYGAIGPSIVDPRSGEILDADILFEANMILGWKRFWRANIDPVAALEELFTAKPEELDQLARGNEMATMAAEISAQGSLLRAALAARGEIAPDDPVPDAYIYEAMKRVTMHEVGHTLGMRHNFRSSFDTPFEKLHDRAWADQNGLASSVMEYPGINVAPRGQANGYYYTPAVGSYDKWAIAFAYTPDPQRAAALARGAARPGHAYGTDEDARGAGALDPTVNVYDLSNDPMAWGKQRADLIREIWNDLPAYVLVDNASYADVTDAFQTLLGQYARAVGTSVKYLGGQYQYRDHVGDRDARAPFVAVPKARQREALAMITDYALGETAFAIPQGVLQNLGADRWSHWGHENTFRGRIDYPLHETIGRLQASLLARVTHPMTLARIRDAEIKYGPEQVLTIPELMRGLTEAIWTETRTAPGRNVTSTRRDLQRAHLDRMIELVIDAPERTPPDARAVARMQLADIARRITQRLTPPHNFDDYTLAHLTESKARIERALDAGLEIKN